MNIFSFHFLSFVFNIFDKDKSGYIDFEEFLQALSVTSRGSIEAKLDCKFKEKITNVHLIYIFEFKTVFQGLSSFTTSTEMAKLKKAKCIRYP